MAVEPRLADIAKIIKDTNKPIEFISQNLFGTYFLHNTANATGVYICANVVPKPYSPPMPNACKVALLLICLKKMANIKILIKATITEHLIKGRKL